MYRLVLTNTCKSTYTSSERLTIKERENWYENEHEPTINIWHEKLTAWMIEKAMLITEKNECVCLFMTKAHTYFTKIYLENKDFTFNSTVRQSMDGSLER